MFQGIFLGTVVDELLMEFEIASVLQIRGDLTALRVQRIGTKLHAFVQGALTLRQDVGNNWFLDVSLVMADLVSGPRT